MTATNQKPAQPKESAVDPFKRAVVGCMRAIAARPDLEVSFASDRPTLSGTRARLPEPPRKMTANDVAVTRGLGDSMALRLACHDAGVHRARLPEGRNARAVFDAVEQARVEALGAMRMSGVGENLAAMLEDRYHRGNYHEVSDRADAPLEDAVALIVRERLTGKAPPESGRKVVDLWRDWIEERAGDDFARLARSVDDQVAFADAVRDLIASLDMGDELGSESGEDDQDDSEAGNADESEGAADDSDAADAAAPQEVEASAEEAKAGEGESTEADAEDMMDDGDMSDTRDTGEARRAPTPFSNLPPMIDYKAFTTKFDEIVRAEDLCDTAELDRLRSYLDKQLANLQGAVARLANRLQRRLMAQQNRSLGLRPRGRPDRRRPPVAGRHRPDASAHLQDGARHRLPRHGGDAAPRQFRLDARPPDHGGGDLRRHPRPHAGALRRQGRDPRLHHPGLEGRAVARGLAAGRQAGGAGPAQRPPPHRLQGGRCALAARAPQPRPDDARGAPQGEHRRRGARLGARPADRRPEQRKVLMMISDGAPVDDSTLSVNPGNYLERHLRYVIEEIETRSPVELIAIGIGHDVTRYYRRAVTIVDAEELAGAMTEKLAELFAEEGSGRRSGGGRRRAAA
jgi:cobaltochelatase CobT